jgi:hypothetical protein
MPEVVPHSTYDVVACDVTSNFTVYTGQITQCFFSDGFSEHQAQLSKHLSRHEWERIDEEFQSVWNCTRLSSTSSLVKTLHFFPGALLFGYGLRRINVLAAERENAIHELIAKLNTFVMQPRGMYMKLFVTIKAGYEKQRMKSYWIKIALTPETISELKSLPSDDPRTQEATLMTYFGLSPPVERPDEDFTGDDSAFLSRWPLPSPAPPESAESS